MTAKLWVEDNDEDELRASCDCGWHGPWRDLIRAVYEDGQAHLTECWCPNCHRRPLSGEQHSLCDGVTEDGEPLGFTCLDAAGDVIYDPPPCSTCGATGSCGCPSPWGDA